MFPVSLGKSKRSLLVSGNSIAAKCGKGQGVAEDYGRLVSRYNQNREEAHVSNQGRPLRMKERIDRHKDGSIKARGYVIDDVLTGYWAWFRKDGTKMRSGYFENGKQVGEWTTYDAKGTVVKVTKMKSPR